MFGVVPKPLWERRIPADERNRIPLALRCLLVEHDDGLVLIDTGIGNKEDAKFRDIYGVRNEGKDGRTLLEDTLAQLGVGPEDVRWVINTHLHFDHAGGNTYRDPAGAIAPTFPRATYVVQKGELEFARHTNERTAASYLPHNFEPVPFQTIEGETEVLPGLRCLPTPGHVPYHQSVLVGAGVLPRRSRAHERAPAAALDHGVRPATARDARVEAPAVPPGRGGGLAAGLRARCGRGGGPARAGGEGRRSCGSLTRGLI